MILITLFQPNKTEYVVNELQSIFMNCILYVWVIMIIDDICFIIKFFGISLVIIGPNIYDIIHVNFIIDEYEFISYSKSHLLSFILFATFIIIVCVNVDWIYRISSYITLLTITIFAIIHIFCLILIDFIAKASSFYTHLMKRTSSFIVNN